MGKLTLKQSVRARAALARPYPALPKMRLMAWYWPILIDNSPESNIEGVRILFAPCLFGAFSGAIDGLESLRFSGIEKKGLVTALTFSFFGWLFSIIPRAPRRAEFLRTARRALERFKWFLAGGANNRGCFFVWHKRISCSGC